MLTLGERVKVLSSELKAAFEDRGLSERLQGDVILKWVNTGILIQYFEFQSEIHIGFKSGLGHAFTRKNDSAILFVLPIDYTEIDLESVIGQTCKFFNITSYPVDAFRKWCQKRTEYYEKNFIKVSELVFNDYLVAVDFTKYTAFRKLYQTAPNPREYCDGKFEYRINKKWKNNLMFNGKIVDTSGESEWFIGKRKATTQYPVFSKRPSKPYELIGIVEAFESWNILKVREAT